MFLYPPDLFRFSLEQLLSLLDSSVGVEALFSITSVDFGFGSFSFGAIPLAGTTENSSNKREGAKEVQ